jgi:hypothetical protein
VSRPAVTRVCPGSTRFCIAHGGGRCTFAGCDKRCPEISSFALHMAVGKRCSADRCMEVSVGGSSLCTSHGGGRRCAIDGCENRRPSRRRNSASVKHVEASACTKTVKRLLVVELSTALEEEYAVNWRMQSCGHWQAPALPGPRWRI